MRVFLWKGCVLLLLFSSIATAQGQPLTFEQVVEIVMQRSPIMGAEHANQRVADAVVQQAGVSPNPVLQLQSQTDGFERLSLIGLAISQPIELGHKKARRIAVAAASRQEAYWEQEARRRSLRRELRERFLRVLLAQARESHAQEMALITQRHYGMAQKRLETGDASGVEVAALKVERDRRAAQQALATGAKEQAMAALGEHLFGEGDPLSKGVNGELAWFGQIPSLDELLAKEPDMVSLRLAQAKSTTRQSQISLEQARGVSDVTVQAGVFMQRDVFPGSSFRPQGAVQGLDDTGALLQLQIQMALPLHDNNSGNIAAAKARLEQSEFEREALKRKLDAELRGVYQTFLAQHQASELLGHQVLPETRRQMETMEQAYVLGFRSAVDLLLAREAYLRAADDALQAAFAESLTAAELEALIGQSLTTESTHL